jgi:hypothetical protein
MTQIERLYQPDELRPGQVAAIDTTVRRTLSGELSTSLVLPTRYGKSLVIRTASVVLRNLGAISAALVFHPSILLRDQFNDAQKMRQTFRLVGIDDRNIGRRVLFHPEHRPTKNGEFFLSATIQSVTSAPDLRVLLDWAAHMAHTTGCPPIVWFDEAHMNAAPNPWGGIALAFQRAGVPTVQTTATAFRSDGLALAGFREEVVKEEPATATRVIGPGSEPHLIRIHELAGIREYVRLLPDHETTFRQAWDEKPSPICKISRVPFDVHLDKLDPQTNVRVAQVLLRDLSATDVRQHLGRIVRDPYVIRQGVRGAITALDHYRHMLPNVACMVYCGNDTDSDKQSNEHAQTIRRIFAQEAPGLHVAIATASTEDSERTLQQFGLANGGIDVIIVKQMGGVGFDVGRAKVIVDLSPVRAVTALIQRMFRGATPYFGISTMTYIVPKEIVGEEIFNATIRDAGGEQTRTTLELVREYEAERKEQDDRPYFTTVGTDPSDFGDSDGRECDASQFPAVQTLISAFPHILGRMSHAEVGERLTINGISVSGGITGHGGPDFTQEIDDLRGTIKSLADEILRRQSGGIYNRDEWVSRSRNLFVPIYQRAGVRAGEHLKDITDVSILKRIKAEMERVHARVNAATV